jgi:hypothetical protein
MSSTLRIGQTLFKDATTLTLSSGAVTRTQEDHIIAAETGTTDDLDTITLDTTVSYSVNSIAYYPRVNIIADAGDTITLKHGTGNLSLPDDTDVTLTDDALVSLRYDGTNWIVFKAVLSSTSVTASQVAMGVLGTPTYDDVQDWSNVTQSAGLGTGGAISDNGDGSVTVAAGTGIIKTTDSNVGANVLFNFAEDTNVSLSDNALNWVYVDYNAGTPAIAATTTFTNMDFHTQFPVGNVYREGTEIHIVPASQQISDFARLVFERSWEIDRVKRASGLSISETGTRNVAYSAGVLYAGLARIPLTAFDTAVADTFSYFYRDGVGGWTEVDSQTQIDNTNYDDNSGTPAALTANRYGVHWVYIAHDGDLYIQYGHGDYTLAQAEAALVPTAPPELTAIATLAGKIIILKSAASFTEITSAFTQTFEGTTVSDHGALAGLTDDDHTQYAALAGRSGGQTLIGGTGSGDDLTLQTTSNATKGDYIFSEMSSAGVLQNTAGGVVTGGNTVAIANGGTGQTTQTAAFDALSPVTTAGDTIYRDGSNNIRLAIGTAGQVLTVNAGATAPEWAAAGGGGLYTSVAILEDQKATTTQGGSASATTWNPRDLNTEVYDPDGIVTISSNQFTPVAGDYEIEASAPGRIVGRQRLRLYNVTGTASVDEGQNGLSSSGDASTNSVTLRTKFTANGTDAYRIDHYTETANADDGLGEAVSDGSNEVYLTLVLRKLA